MPTPVPTAPPTAAPAVTLAPAVATAAPALANVIRTCIDGEFEGWSGETAFPLCNGQVWVQLSYDYTYHYAYRPDVILVSTSGGWEMSVDGVRGTIRVQQVPFTRTCIEGTFEGWEGDTVFPLCNGQIWQQAEYAYTYRYRYRPDVLIYQSPFGGYRMQVEGVDRVIRVRRLQ